MVRAAVFHYPPRALWLMLAFGKARPANAPFVLMRGFSP